MKSGTTPRLLRHISIPDSFLVRELEPRPEANRAATSRSLGGEHSPLGAGWLKSLMRGIRRLGLYLTAAVIFVYSFFPVYWMVLSSVRAPEKLFLDTSLIHWPPDFSAYKTLLQLTDYPSHFVNSLIVASVNIVQEGSIMIASDPFRIYCAANYGAKA